MPSNWVNWFKDYWNIVAGVAAILLTAILAFLLPPPFRITSDADQLNSLARFVAVIVVGLMFVPILRWKSRKFAWWWVTSAIVTLIIGLACLFTYEKLKRQWTCLCMDENTLIVIGSGAPNPNNPSVTQYPNNCRKWLEDVSCNASLIWTKDSIESNQLTLMAVYILALPLFIICALSAAQAVYCQQQPQNRRS
jgi:hypothetical protein